MVPHLIADLMGDTGVQDGIDAFGAVAVVTLLQRVPETYGAVGRHLLIFGAVLEYDAWTVRVLVKKRFSIP